MKRWQWIALCVAGLAGGAYVYFHYGSGPKSVMPGASTSDTAGGSERRARMDWQMVNRPEDGFRVEMPGDPRDVHVPAYNEAGGTEPVKMLFVSPDGDTTFAITWSDDPPVARASHNVADQTLEQARDGMLTRTQTTLMKEFRVTTGGYPSLDITAKNNEGGWLDARLIVADNRLYTLMALFPSQGARREQDVVRFYNSFAQTGVGTRLPAAAPKG